MFKFNVDNQSEWQNVTNHLHLERLKEKNVSSFQTLEYPVTWNSIHIRQTKGFFS